MQTHNGIDAFTHTNTLYKANWEGLITNNLTVYLLLNLSNITTCASITIMSTVNGAKPIEQQLGICGSKTWGCFQLISFDLTRVTKGPMTRLRITQGIPQTNTKTATTVFALHISLITVIRGWYHGGNRQCCLEE